MTLGLSKRAMAYEAELRLIAGVILGASLGWCQPSQPLLSANQNNICGNPMLESQLWIAVPATIVSVADAGRIEVRLSEGDTQLSVRIAGVRFLNDRAAVRAFKELARKRLVNQSVSVFVNPHEWLSRPHKPRQVIASVNLGDGTDIGLLLIENALAHFRKQRPYRISRNLTCRCRLADHAASGIGANGGRSIFDSKPSVQ
jgi:hypothetical protein